MNRNRRTPPASLLVSLLFWTLAATAPAAAWEWVYGPGASAEDGHRRVTPAVICPGGGYLAVGTHGIGTANPDVYVVRTNNAGGLVWELSYDVQGGQTIDEGIALAEVPAVPPGPPAVVILSNTQVNGLWQPALTQLDCNGAFLWSWTYPPNVQQTALRGHDLVRTATPGAGGDLAVAGVATVGANQDAFLMRTNAAGVPLWSAAYNTGVAVAGQEVFNALTEAQLLPGQNIADLVAVGRYVGQNNNVQGLVARVSGVNGAVGAAPQCMAHQGGGAADTFYSVTQLVTAPNAGQFALVGVTSNGPWIDDVWVVRAGANPCVIQAVARIGDAGGVPASEGGLDVREMRVPLAGLPNLPVGSLAITGFQGPAAGGPFDAFLLLVQPGGLAPILANLFGDHALRNEVGVSLAQNPGGGPQPPGFVIAGWSATDWDGFGDPQDLYLVDAVNGGGVATNCSVGWAPNNFLPAWPAVNLVPALWAPAQNAAAFPLIFPMWNPLQVCP